MAAYTVSQLGREFSQALARSFPLVQVEGEVGSITASGQKHWYFNLKDKVSQIRCVFFKNKNQFASFFPVEGDKISLYATVEWYATRGDLQLIVESIQKIGQGNLYEQFLQTKKELETIGWFRPERKRLLPSFITHVGVITSPDGAVMHDIVSTITRRTPFVNIIIYPCVVQGIGAAAQIAAQIQRANTRQECAALIVCRGGGSLEDLAAFNSREVAQAIFNSALPIISAVGHETDFSIADFVADIRAATPTAAAELLQKSLSEINTDLEAHLKTLSQHARTVLQNQSQRLDYAQKNHRHMRGSFEQFVRNAGERLKNLSQVIKNQRIDFTHQAHEDTMTLRRAMIDTHKTQEHDMTQLSNQLSQKIHSHVKRTQGRLGYLHNALAHIDMMRVLKAGYAVVRNEKQEVISSPADMTTRQPYEIMFFDGKVKVQKI